MTPGSPSPVSLEGVLLNIPGFTLHCRIGRGSSGEVWLATDPMNKWRAVKVVMRRQDSDRDRGYEREFNAIKRYEDVCHRDATLMPIVHVGKDPEGRFFFYAMELADNANDHSRWQPSGFAPEELTEAVQAYRPRTLRSELRRRGRLPPAECVEHGIALAIALEQLHAHDLIHRDIKPDNIIFVYGQPKLADVGLVADVDATYSLAGTSAYLSPEPVRKEPADIFALGKVLYEMLTGRGADEFSAAPRDFASFSDEERNAFNELNAVVLRACDPEVANRHASASHLREELELLRANESVLRLRHLEERDRQRRRLTRKLKVGCAILGGLLLLTVAATYLRATYQRAEEEAWRRELREIRISRFGNRASGWSGENWSRLERAAVVRMDQDVLEEATAVLAGLDGRQAHVFRDLPVASAAFGPDGRALFGGAGDHHAILIDANGILTKLAMRGEGPVSWTPDGVPLQLVAVTNALVLRDAKTGMVHREYSWPSFGSSNLIPDCILAMTPNMNGLAAGFRDRVWVWSDGQGPGEIATEATALAFSPDGSFLASGSPDGTTCVYEIPSLEPVAVLPPPFRGSPILSLAFGRNRVVPYRPGANDNPWLLATGDLGAAIVIWDLRRRLPRSFCLGSPWSVHALAFHPDGLILASAGRNEGRLWDARSGQLLLRLAGTVSSGNSRALAFDRTGNRIALGGESGAGRASAAVWELERHRGIQTLRGLSSASRKVWFSGDSRRVAALSDNWHLGIWDVATGGSVVIFETPVGMLADNAGGCFDASAGRFAFASGAEACLYDLAAGSVTQRWRLQSGRSDQLCFDRLGRLLLLRREPRSDAPYGWRLYHLPPSADPVLLKEQQATNWTARDMLFRPAGPGGERFLVWNGDTGTNRFILEYDLQSGTEIRKHTAEYMSDLRVLLDPSGRWLAYSAFTNAPGMQVVDLWSGESTRRISIDPRALSPSGRQFAGDGFFWPDSSRLEDAIRIGTDWIAGQYVWAFSPDGKFLACGTYEGPVLVADLAEVQRRLGSLEQVKRY